MRYSILTITLFFACLLCINITSGFSVHFITAPLLSAFVISWILILVPRLIRVFIQIFFGELLMLICLIDCYCQELFATPISPQILSNTFLSDSREIYEFISVFIDFHILIHWRITALLLLIIIFPIALLWGKYFHSNKKLRKGVLLTLLIICVAIEAPASYRYLQLFCQNNDMQKVEGLIFQHIHEEIPTPFHRFIFSYYSIKISEKQLSNIKNSSFNISIDSCTHTSPNIVLIIGESYNKHHSTLYDYDLPTTPLQQKRKDKGELFVFNDVITPWNITSNVFLDMFSMWEHGMVKTIDHYPLFPILFKKAGYVVNFFSNQYIRKGFSKGATNQSGHFFLADSELSDSLFSYRNFKSYKYDLGLVSQIKEYVDKDSSNYRMDIVHLIGQHFKYSMRYPQNETIFSTKSYKGRYLDKEAKKIVAHYDNATHYNDIVVDSLIKIYKEKDAVIIYVADHGEEVYDDLHIHGRLFQEPTALQAKNEYEVPMWIWCSRKYRNNHSDIIASIEDAQDKPFMTDGIPQLLLSLAGIKSKWNRNSYNILSPKYKGKSRIISGSSNYDILCNAKDSN